MFRYSTSSANSSNRRSSTKPRSKPSDLSGQGSRRDDGIAPRRTRHGIEGVLRALRFLVLDAREHSGSEGAGARRHRYGEGDVKSPPPLQGASGSAQFGCFSFGEGESFHCACDELADITLPEAFELLVGGGWRMCRRSCVCRRKGRVQGSKSFRPPFRFPRGKG